MKQSLNKTELSVKNNIVKVIQIGEIEYISLTDLAKYADKNDPRYPIQNWMRTKDVILYLGLWEKLHNKDFKRAWFNSFEKNAGSNKSQKRIKDVLMTLK